MSDVTAIISAYIDTFSQRLANLLTKNLPNTPVDKSNSLLRSMSDKLDCLIDLDRRVDLITPLLTQLTYEGLVDELIGIKNCTISRFKPQKYTAEY